MERGNVTATVMTVLGPISAADLGVTLPHEHLFIDLLAYVDELGKYQSSEILDDPVELRNLQAIRGNPYGNRLNCILDDVDLACREVELFRAAGGGTIVDVKNSDIGSNPIGLRDVAEQTGVNVVAGVGHYVNFAQGAKVRGMSVDQIAGGFLGEIENGLGASGIRPGIIGEIGTTWPLHPNEEKVLRAAAIAHRHSGLTISVHVHPPTRSGHGVLDILEDEGVDLRRVVLGHVDAALAHSDIEFAEAVDYHRSLAQRGAFIEYDLCGNSGYFTDGANAWWLPSDRERCKAIAELASAGFLESLLISQDVGHKHYLTEYGGWGYSHVLTGFRAMLADFGIDANGHDQITRRNPARMLVGSRVPE
jgi:phosphotriesterase-related protein